MNKNRLIKDLDLGRMSAGNTKSQMSLYSLRKIEFMIFWRKENEWRCNK